MFSKIASFAFVQAIITLTLWNASPVAIAQMDDEQARSYLRYKFPQAVGEAWRRHSEAVNAVGTLEEKAALARLRLAFDKEDFGGPSVHVICQGTRCELRINGSFVGLSSILALSGAASAHLKAAPGLAIRCFTDNIDSLAKNVITGSSDNPYVPLLPCLGKPNAGVQALIDNQHYNDMADIAVIEMLAFVLAHELAHIKNGDFDGINERRSIRDMESKADLAAVEFLARAGVDSFFGAGATGVFRLAERLSVRGTNDDYPPTECRVLYAIFAGGYYLMNLNRSKLTFTSEYERQLRFEFFDWKIIEAADFVKRNIGKTMDGSCAMYFEKN